MKKARILLMFALLIGVSAATEKRKADIQWKKSDCSSPLMLPQNQWGVSQYGKGKYRIDGDGSHGHFNCIYITFQKGSSLNPVSVLSASKSLFTINNQKVSWRTFKTIVEGRAVIRKEALMPNILPRQKKGNGSDYIWIRMDADSQEILDRLTPDAEGIIQDAAESRPAT